MNPYTPEDEARWMTKAKAWLSDWLPHHGGLRTADVVRVSDIGELEAMLRAEWKAGRASALGTTWTDADDQWTKQVRAAHPSTSNSHMEYATALRMVSNRHSKSALVALVNWLLLRQDEVFKKSRVRLIHALDHIRLMECTMDHDEDMSPCPVRTAKEALDNRECSLCKGRIST